MASPKLILIRGLPGSGKSTLAEMFFNLKVFEADDYFYDEHGIYNFDGMKIGEAHSACQANVINTLSLGYSCVVSNTSTTEREVKVYQDIAERYKADFISLIVENRHGNKSIHGVPDNVMDNMRKRFTVRL